MQNHPETMNHSGAHRLAARIRAYWEARGKFPAVHVEQVLTRGSPAAGESFYYVVRSNMIGGFPQ